MLKIFNSSERKNLIKPKKFKKNMKKESKIDYSRNNR